MIREGETWPDELVDACLARIAEVDPELKAVVYLAEKQARDEGRAASAAIKENRVTWREQPLFGVPITVKDCIDVAGMPTACGIPSRREAARSRKWYGFKPRSTDL